MTDKPMIEATAIWLRRHGDTVEVLVEVGETWRLAITEFAEAPFSHIAEANGIKTWPHDER